MCNTSTKKEESKQTSQATMTGQESNLFDTGLSSYNANANGAGMSLVNSILAGNTNQPGDWGNMLGGISESMITDMSQKAISDLLPSFQSSGILDSGVAASIAGRTAGDIRRASTEFNLTNKQNLLNLALSGQTSLQNANTNQYSVLANQLAGLRKTTTKGKSSSSYTPSPLQTAMSVMGGIGSLATGIGGLATGLGWGNSPITAPYTGMGSTNYNPYAPQSNNPFAYGTGAF
jgi:hypothetical protein